MNNRIIGLTGYYCSGKSTVENILAGKFGYTIIDADKVGHIILDEQQALLVKTFGEQIVTDNKINRKILGSIVFGDRSKLRQLNELTHPLIFDKIKQTISDKDKKFVVSAALYFETHCDTLCEATYIVKAPLPTIIERGMLRDGHGRQHIENILKAQKLDQYINRPNVTIINNDGDIDKLTAEISRIFRE